MLTLENEETRRNVIRAVVSLLLQLGRPRGSGKCFRSIGWCMRMITEYDPPDQVLPSLLEH